MAAEGNGEIDLARICILRHPAPRRGAESVNDQQRCNTADQDIQAVFGQEMFRIYQRALSEADYKATRFLHMLHEHGGLQTARILVHASTVSEGYTALWERGRLDLTVEALIHDDSRWHPLFTLDELAICARRLSEYEYLKAK